MAALRLAAAAIVLAFAVPARAEPAQRWAGSVREASRRFAIPERWIWRVMRAESGGRTRWRGRPITSRAGAMGLMQVMPATWRELRAVHGLGPDPHDPRDNILAGTAYLRAMYDRFGYPGLFAAYNAGPARYAEHLATGRRLPRETVAYVAKLASTPSVSGRGNDARLRTVAGPSLYAIRSNAPAGPPSYRPDRTAADSIFVALGATPAPPSREMR